MIISLSWYSCITISFYIFCFRREFFFKFLNQFLAVATLFLQVWDCCNSVVCAVVGVSVVCFAVVRVAVV